MLDTKDLLLAVEAKFGRGKISDWKNRDYIDLGTEIYKATKTSISPVTLKRIFGKVKTSSDYIPQAMTMQALEAYADIAASRMLKESPVFVANDNSILVPIQKKRRKTYYAIAFVCMMAFLILWVKIYIANNQDNNSTDLKARLTLLSTEGEKIKTAYFSYEILDKNLDSIAIVYDSEFPPIPLNKNKSNCSYIYQHPGIYKVKLVSKGKTISNELTIYVQTTNWQCLGHYYKQKYDERYFPVNLDFNANATLSCSTENMYRVGMDTSKICILRLDNFYPTKTNGDNFQLKTRLKNSDIWNNTMCNSVFLSIIGKTGNMIFRFSNPGCSYWTYGELSEKRLMGSEQNLSMFCTDMTTWQNIEIINKQKSLSIVLNGKGIFQDQYKNSIGEILGVSVIFHGNINIDYYQFQADNKLLFGLGHRELLN